MWGADLEFVFGPPKMVHWVIMKQEHASVLFLLPKTRPLSDSEAPTFNEQTIQSVDKSTIT